MPDQPDPPTQPIPIPTDEGQTPTPPQETTSPTPPDQPSPEIKQETTSKKPIILSILLFIAIAVAGFFGYKYFQSNQQPITDEQPVPTATPTPSLDPTANWETYSNSLLNFSLLYPNGLYLPNQVKQLGDILLIQNYKDSPGRQSSPEDFQLVLAIAKDDGKKLEEYPEAWKKELGEFSIEQINIGGKPAIKGLSGQKQQAVPTIWVKNGDFLYTFQLSTPESSNAIWFDQILSTFEFTDELQPTTTSQTPYPNKPEDWKEHVYPSVSLVIFTPSQWKSNIEEFPENTTNLIRFWEGDGPDTSTIQLNIKNNWDNIGLGQYTYFTIADSIQAYRTDPPKFEEKTLERYQTNFHFERQGKVYSLLCVHNWLETNINTCETMLTTLIFTDK